MARYLETMRNRLGIIVGGQKDFAALRARFSSAFEVLKLDGPRGHGVTPSDIVAAAKKQIAILKALGASEILVILDCETRKAPYNQCLRELSLLFRTMGTNDSVSIAMPNRMIENWYLADIEYLSKRKKTFFKGNLKQKNYEGKNGLAMLKKFLQKNVTYNEVIHGAQMFKLIRFSVAKTNSRSFSVFYEIINRFI